MIEILSLAIVALTIQALIQAGRYDLTEWLEQ